MFSRDTTEKSELQKWTIWREIKSSEAVMRYVTRGMVSYGIRSSYLSYSTYTVQPAGFYQTMITELTALETLLSPMIMIIRPLVTVGCHCPFGPMQPLESCGAKYHNARVCKNIFPAHTCARPSVYPAPPLHGTVPTLMLSTALTTSPPSRVPTIVHTATILHPTALSFASPTITKAIQAHAI